jgi:iron-sulfur cluster repair protein YtfE (RIC family)
VEAGDFEGAARHFAEFRTGLLRHIKIEEKLVFPEFEAATGLAGNSGPTGVMRFEHCEIIRLLDLIRDLFAGHAPSSEEFERLRGALLAVLHGHNDKEERILYPMTDKMTPPQRLRSLVDDMRAFMDPP